mmetsp:Transcript_29800/g.45184  ORF Transcript_29800/g.45184 Transcript_29800/m.45184 type:complete len:99 (+) Transcript_29800:422-718(+)|eukprot:CAMPEP_0178917178 /NCGR_PEP_ID=MMETSP0786-20121207/13099_1 /TAXON_ID=186022 /ORGANISM="Thalassionema frauenfeldii, Strain CCMP 1798" /LENGTH=98 /DNA_ID=CAMNT_0020590693 /DNA_START=253 /DNA_END=549 /DNA_ORIENTATION=+
MASGSKPLSLADHFTAFMEVWRQNLDTWMSHERFVRLIREYRNDKRYLSSQLNKALTDKVATGKWSQITDGTDRTVLHIGSMKKNKVTTGSSEILPSH